MIYTLICDYCGDDFQADVSPTDLFGEMLTPNGPEAMTTIEAAQRFDPKTASALCAECGTVLGKLHNERDKSARDEAVYQAFVETCSESVVRKMRGA